MKRGYIIHRAGTHLRAKIFFCVSSSHLPGLAEGYCDCYSMENQGSPAMWCIIHSVRWLLILQRQKEVFLL